MRLVYFEVGHLRGKALLLIFASLLFIFLFYRGVHDIKNRVTSIEFFATTHSGTVVLTEAKYIDQIVVNLLQGDVSNESFSGQGKYRILVRRKSGSQIFLLDKPGMMYEQGTGKLYRLKDGGSCLKPFLDQVDAKNPYGEFLTWSTAKNIFKKYDKAKIIDVETGMAFMVQRRAGSRHADVQPLTAEDSDIMKMIYKGKWSWKRRAVIIETGGRRIAGSMNGMPHGAGAIRGNKFNGHFCIHFRDSKLHGGGTDIAHQLMVWKAAGTVEEMLEDKKPEEVVRIMMTALEQDDNRLAIKFLNNTSQKPEAEILRQLQQISWIAVSDIKTINKGSQSVIVKVTYKLSNGAQFTNRSLALKPSRVDEKKTWKIDSADLLKLITQSRSGSGDNSKVSPDQLAAVKNES